MFMIVQQIKDNFGPFCTLFVTSMKLGILFLYGITNIFGCGATFKYCLYHYGSPSNVALHNCKNRTPKIVINIAIFNILVNRLKIVQQPCAIYQMKAYILYFYVITTLVVQPSQLPVQMGPILLPIIQTLSTVYFTKHITICLPQPICILQKLSLII